MAASSLAPHFKSLVVQPRAKHTASVIFAHGLGDTGHGWLPVAKQLSSSFPSVKWVLPHAPSAPVTLNGGLSMPSWFDIASLSDVEGAEDEQGMLQSARGIQALVQREIDSGIPGERIIVGGFSQGGVISILAALTAPTKLAGLAILSSWMPLRAKAVAMRTPHFTSIPVFWGHGTSDPVVQYQYGSRSVAFIKAELGVQDVRFESYKNMPHSACDEEIQHLTEWLQKVLPNE